MINLKNFKINKLFLIIILLLLSEFVLSVENKIIFKINDNAFTSYDYEKRIRYLDFIGGNKNAKKEIIIEDLITVYLFYEYFKDIGIKDDFKKEINDIFEKIKQENINNNKEYEYEKDKENILFNIKIDLIRKNILEKLLNQHINNINISNQEIDLLYIFNIKYINFESDENYKIKRNINNLETINFDNIMVSDR